MENIPQITPYAETTRSRLLRERNPRLPDRKRKGEKTPERYFSTLAEVVEETRRDLKDHDAPFRLRIHRNRDGVFMDVIAKPGGESPGRIFTRVITRDNMDRLVRSIHNRNGLIVEYTV